MKVENETLFERGKEIVWAESHKYAEFQKCVSKCERLEQIEGRAERHGIEL